VNENGGMAVKLQRRTLQSQLSKFDDEDAQKARNGTDSRVLLLLFLTLGQKYSLSITIHV
jgi:hypothetical protein